MRSDVTFIVNSCDKYEDAWHPFFECLWHFAGELPWPIILNTETKQYISPHYQIRCINSPKRASWSKRLYHVLESVESEFIFFLLDDYFLRAPFDADRFEAVVAYMKAHKDVAVVDVAPRWAETAEDLEANAVRYKDAEDSFTERNNAKFNITCTPGVWQTEALRSLLRMHEDVWDFEIYVGIRAKKYSWKVVRFNTRVPGIFDYSFQIWSGMGITAGHWLPKNKPFFESLGIEVNYDRLGILEASSVEEVRRLTHNNLLALIKKIPRKIRKRFTRKRSLV